MGRPQSLRWNYFTKVNAPGNMKTKRAKCKFCGRTVSASSQNMDTHARNCTEMKRTLGALLEEPQKSQQSVSPTVATETQSASHTPAPLKGPLSSIATNNVSSSRRDELNVLFAKAIHETATSFSFFENPSWVAFFRELSSSWHPPPPRHIGGALLDNVYENIMAGVLEAIIRKSSGGVLGIDGATSRLPKSVSNVIIHNTKPLFIEYLRSDLKRETTVNVVDKIEDVMRRLDEQTGFQMSAYSFISESCNGMRDVRRKLVEKKLVLWEYGCSTHCLHNLSSDIGSLEPFKGNIKDALYVSKTVKNTGMVRKLYEQLCEEKFGAALTMVLFSSTRWTTCNLMLLRLLKARPALTLMSHALLNEREQRQIDTTFNLHTKLDNILQQKSFWDSLSTLTDILNPISAALGFLESDTATMADVYASFIFVRRSLQCSKLSCHQKAWLDSKLMYRCDRIYSPVHALAFQCDPFYDGFRANARSVVGDEFMELGKGNISIQCHNAWKLLSEKENNYTDVMSEFMSLSILKEPLLKSLNTFRPQLIWGQMEGKFKLLSKVLVRVFSAPSSTAGVERNHKVGKAVMTQLRCTLKDFSFMKHVSVSFNGNQLKRSISTTRGVGFDKSLSTFFDNVVDESSVMVDFNPDNSSLDMSDMDEELVRLETSLLDVNGPEQIPDDLIFFNAS